MNNIKVTKNSNPYIYPEGIEHYQDYRKSITIFTRIIKQNPFGIILRKKIKNE